MKILRSALLASVAAALVGTAAPASASPPELYYERGLSAQAYFVSTSGFTTTFFWVAGWDYQRMFGSGHPERRVIAYGSLAVVNRITGEQLHSSCDPPGWEWWMDKLPVGEGEFVVDEDLQSARLTTEFECYGVGRVNVNLTWTANGVRAGRGGYVFGTAPSASGTVTDGERNFTPLPSDPVETSIYRFPY